MNGPLPTTIIRLGYYLTIVLLIPCSLTGWMVICPDSYPAEKRFFFGLLILMLELVYPYYYFVGKLARVRLRKSKHKRVSYEQLYLLFGGSLYAFLVLKTRIAFVVFWCYLNRQQESQRSCFEEIIIWMVACSLVLVYLHVVSMSIRILVKSRFEIDR